MADCGASMPRTLAQARRVNMLAAVRFGLEVVVNRKMVDDSVKEADWGYLALGVA